MEYEVGTWTRRLLLRNEVEKAQGLDRRIADIIKGEPDQVEREKLLDIVAQELGSANVEEVERILKRK